VGLAGVVPLLLPGEPLLDHVAVQYDELAELVDWGVVRASQQQ
jgi:hypothetical protein